MSPFLVCLPGTLCAPTVFGQVAEHSTLPSEDVVPLSWLTIGQSWDLVAVAGRVAGRLDELTNEPVLLAGHSTGGVIALLLALQNPGRVKGLLLSNTGANMKGHGDVEGIIASLEHEWGPDLRARILDRCFHYAPEPTLREELDRYASTLTRRAVVEALTSQLNTDLSSQLGALDLPAVVAHGRHDPVRPTTQAAHLADRLPQGELHLLDAGHTPMLENPAEYGRAVDRLVELCRAVDINQA